MDARKGKQIDIGRSRQTGRTVSTQPNRCEGGRLTHQQKHSVSMEIGWSLINFIKRQGGGTLDEIERETGVKLTFLSSRNEGSILVEGNSAESVTKASEKIQIVVDKATNSRDFDYSHFISLPLAVHPGLVDKLVNFQNTILGIACSKESKAPASGTSSSKVEDSGIEKSIFINPKTFHLTVLMLKLWNKDRVKTAAEVLQSVLSKVMDALENQPVLIRLKGLECMRGSVTKAGVLYAPVEEIGGKERLLRACQVITDAFIEAGLVIEKDAGHKLKLHATLMNGRHRKRDNRTTKLDSFDARAIFDLYGSEEWGVYPIREAHLSKRFVYGRNGYYHCCASIPFPTTGK